MSVSRKLFPSKKTTERRPNLDKIMEGSRDHVPPDVRLREHLASKRHQGPCPGFSVRVNMRHKQGDERPTVRKMYDKTAQKGRKRGKAPS